MPHEQAHPDELGELMTVVSTKDWILLLAIALLFAVGITWYSFAGHYATSGPHDAGPTGSAGVSPRKDARELR